MGADKWGDNGRATLSEFLTWEIVRLGMIQEGRKVAMRDGQAAPQEEERVGSGVKGGPPTGAAGGPGAQGGRGGRRPGACCPTAQLSQ